MATVSSIMLATYAYVSECKKNLQYKKMCTYHLKFVE